MVRPTNPAMMLPPPSGAKHKSAKTWPVTPQAAKTNAASSASVNGAALCRLSNFSGPPGIFIPKPNRRDRRDRSAANKENSVKSDGKEMMGRTIPAPDSDREFQNETAQTSPLPIIFTLPPWKRNLSRLAGQW
jgi:hypothetical protein